MIQVCRFIEAFYIIPILDCNALKKQYQEKKVFALLHFMCSDFQKQKNGYGKK
jgi:hypothetical protein